MVRFCHITKRMCCFLVENVKSGLEQKWKKLKKWFTTDEGTILALVAFFPLGLWLMWKQQKFSKLTRTLVTAVMCIVTLTFAGMFNLNVNALAKSKELDVKLATTQEELKLQKESTEKHKSTIDTKKKEISQLNSEIDSLQAYKEKMKPYETIQAADAEKIKQDIAAADKVKKLIDDLPQDDEIELSHKEKVTQARTAYAALSADQKKHADESVIKASEERIKTLEKIAAEEATKKAEEEKQAAEEAARKAEEEARGYETGITYDQLARTPDDFEGKKVKFYGQVVQVMTGDGVTQLRFKANDDYDQVLYLEYSNNIVKTRILEDDYITIYGTSEGLFSYQSTMSGTITIPAVSVDKIDQ